MPAPCVQADSQSYLNRIGSYNPYRAHRARVSIADTTSSANPIEAPSKRGPNTSDADESRLDRLSKEELDARLGADRYSIARDIENLQRNVKTGRLGREAFPIIVFILLLIFLGEH